MYGLIFTMYLAAEQLQSEISFLICLNKASSEIGLASPPETDFSGYFCINMLDRIATLSKAEETVNHDFPKDKQRRKAFVKGVF